MAAKRSTRGFTLLEAIIAGALFLIGITGVLTAWQSILVSMEHQRRCVDAVSVAEDVLDDLRLRHRDAPELKIGTHERYFTKTRAPAPEADPLGYTVEWEVLDNGANTFRRVELVVRWRGLDARQHSIDFYTIRAS